MLNRNIALVAILLLFTGIACTTPAPMVPEDETGVTGVLLDADTYDRISGAEIRLVEDERVTTTNENGVFAFVAVSVGTHTVMINAEGYGTIEQTMEVARTGSRVELKISR